MNLEKEIFTKIGKDAYSVPEGYFDSLKDRLETIPHGQTVDSRAWMRLKPYLAMAASFVAILIIGNAVLRNTALKHQSQDQFYNEDTYAELMLLNQPGTFYNAMEYEHEDLSDEDIINHLIESGTEMEYLAYSGDQKY